MASSNEVAMWAVVAVGAFVALWCVITLIVSTIGGWRSLAQRYRSELPFSGRKWYFRSGLMNGFARYGSALTVGVNPSGLYLGVVPLFRPGHPPLFIPWGEISVASEQRFVRAFIVFTFRGVPGASLRLPERFGREVLESARLPTTMHAP